MNSSRQKGLGTLFFTGAALVAPVHRHLHHRPLGPAGAGLALRPWVQKAVRLLLATLAAWQMRHRDRRMLAELDDHLLRDIGVTRAEARAEFEKPFWRA